MKPAVTVVFQPLRIRQLGVGTLWLTLLRKVYRLELVADSSLAGVLSCARLGNQLLRHRHVDIKLVFVVLGWSMRECGWSG